MQNGLGYVNALLRIFLETDVMGTNCDENFFIPEGKAVLSKVYVHINS